MAEHVPNPALQPVFDDPEAWRRDQLRDINYTPVAYLAAVGAQCGAGYDDAFLHAMELIDFFGTSRPIRPADASMLCRAMRGWVMRGWAGDARHAMQ
jgi:hypothetical protein